MLHGSHGRREGAQRGGVQLVLEQAVVLLLEGAALLGSTVLEPYLDLGREEVREGKCEMKRKLSGIYCISVMGLTHYCICLNLKCYEKKKYKKA